MAADRIFLDSYPGNEKLQVLQRLDREPAEKVPGAKGNFFALILRRLNQRIPDAAAQYLPTLEMTRRRCSRFHQLQRISDSSDHRYNESEIAGLRCLLVDAYETESNRAMKSIPMVQVF